MGPYETERDTLREPMPREVRALHTAGEVRSGDPDRVVRDTALRHMTEACQAAGVELGAHDRRTLAWLTRWEPSTVQVIIGLITRAHEAGKHAAVRAVAERIGLSDPDHVHPDEPLAFLCFGDLRKLIEP